MNVSWNWLSEWVDLKKVGTPDDLAALLTSRGLEVEGVRPLSRGFEKVISAQVVKKGKHPDADRLSVCKVSTGQGEPLDIVCGAQNFKEGDKVALAQVGADLPNGMKIKAGKIRGATSLGMLCSLEELGLAEKAEGILVLDPATPVGRPMAQVLGLDDTILEISLTPNRGDCLSHWGIAREVAAAVGDSLKEPSLPALPATRAKMGTRLAAGEEGPQFYGVEIRGVKVGPSPDWVVRRLEALGARSINNVVDAANWVMFEYGHPMHSYDADRLEGDTLTIEVSRKGVKLPLLDGQTIELTGGELVITDGAGPVALAGVMGGGNSEVRDDTVNLYLECAEFSPVAVRKAAGRFQRHSEAAHRFERGIDPMGLERAIMRLAQLITEWAGGTVGGSSVSRSVSRDPQKEYRPRQMVVPAAYFSDFLGMEVTKGRVEEILRGLGCEVEGKGDSLRVTVPSYRLDLSIPEDLAEEVARTIGYDKIPATVPPLSSVPGPEPVVAEERAKDALKELGLREAVNFAFTSRQRLAKFGLESKIFLKNPLSEETECLVPSLIPGLVNNALDNWNHHFGSEPLAIRLFELRPTFRLGASEVKATGQLDTGVGEDWRLSFLLAGPKWESALRNELGEVDFFDLKGVVEGFLSRMNVKGLRFRPLGEAKGPMASVHSLFHPGQSMEVWVGKDCAGYFGRLHPAVSRGWKVKSPLWIAELDWSALSKMSRLSAWDRSFSAWDEFPGVERDFALLVKSHVQADDLVQSALKVGKPLAKTAKIFDIYRGSQVAEGMTSIAVRVIFSNESRSLQESEVDEVCQKILGKWKTELGAELRG